MPGKPLLIVLSAPSGCGKSTLCRRLMSTREDMVYSVSCTTRPPRGTERDGIDYFFVSPERFRQLVEEEAFLEYADVHGYRYGTLKQTVRHAMHQGHSVLLDIDVQGAGQVRQTLQALPPDDLIVTGFVDIFVMPPSMEVLRERLEKRGEDSPEVIEQRMRNAMSEINEAGLYRYQMVNDELETAHRTLWKILEEEQNR